jgi:hypothetical protein
MELLKTQIHGLLVDKLGEPSDADLAPVKREAQEYGLDNRQFDRLLQEIYSSINWAKVRDEREGKDRVVGEPIFIFDLQVKSLNKLGEVLFSHPEKAMKYLTDDVFLKANVNYLSHHNIDIAMRYTDLYHSEKDEEKRYLKICYRLNPKLPYRIDDRLFQSIEELLAEGFKSLSFFNKISKEYLTDRLHIWLQAQEPERFRPENRNKTVVSFLGFVYSVNATYPFYIEEELFNTPQELVTRALCDLVFWKQMFTYSGNGKLFAWFDALGRPDWRDAYQSSLNDIRANDLLADEEKHHASVQQLLYIIDPGLAPPLLVASQDVIENLSLAATKTLTIPIWLSLKSAGFVKPIIRWENEIEGLTIDQSQLVFFNLTGQNQGSVNVNIDPQKLKKETAYLTTLQIISPYQTIDIQVRIKTVFPLRALLFSIGKYSLFGALFFGFFRWLLAAGTGLNSSLAPQIITTAVGRSLPDNYVIFYWVFVAMLTSFILAVRIIRKVERV